MPNLRNASHSTSVVHRVEWVSRPGSSSRWRRSVLPARSAIVVSEFGKSSWSAGQTVGSPGWLPIAGYRATSDQSWVPRWRRIRRASSSARRSRSPGAAKSLSNTDNLRGSSLSSWGSAPGGTGCDTPCGPPSSPAGSERAPPPHSSSVPPSAGTWSGSCSATWTASPRGAAASRSWCRRRWKCSAALVAVPVVAAALAALAGSAHTWVGLQIFA